MNGALAIFVKTRGLSPIKTRLAETLGTQSAEEFYAFCLQAVASTAQNFSWKPYWAVREENGLADPLWSGFQTIYTGGGKLGECLHTVYDTLLQNHDAVMMIGADCPQLSLEDLQTAAKSLKKSNFVVGPSADGGFYLFGGHKPLSQDIWTSTPYSTETTLYTLQDKLPEKAALLTQKTDVDVFENLVAMIDEMPEDPTPEQQFLMNWVLRYTNPHPEHKTLRNAGD